MRPDPPALPGVRRQRVLARGVDFHVTEAGDPDGMPVVLLHGWPMHHYAWRHVMAALAGDGLRLVAPDLPGYGWSGPAPHRWAKEDVASDVLALLDALGIDRCLLAGHDWGGYVGFLCALREPGRFGGLVPCNIPHPWVTARTVLPGAWRLAQYQPLIATLGVPLHRYTPLVRRVNALLVTDRSVYSDEDLEIYAAPYREPATARAARDTYRTLLLRELPALARRPERRRLTVPTTVVFGTRDRALPTSWVAPATALADDYVVRYVEGCGHNVTDQRPDAVVAAIRERL